MTDEHAEDVVDPENSMPLRSHHSGSSERSHQHVRQAQLIIRLVPVLLEFYNCEGPISLLDAIAELSRACVEIMAIYGASQIFEAVVLMGDVSFALYELSDDSKVLQHSIKSYQHGLNGDLAVPIPRRIYAETRLAHALLKRYLALNDQNSFRAALNLMNAHHTGCDHPEISTQAWVTIVTALLKSNRAAWTFYTVDLHDLHHCLVMLRNMRNSHPPRSLWILSLIAETSLASAIFIKTRQHEHFHAVIGNARSGLQMCSRHAGVLRYQLLTGLANNHLNAHSNAKEKTDIISHLNATIELVSEAQTLTDFLSRSPSKKWHLVYRWAMPTMYRGIYNKDLDDMERATDAMKEALLMWPNSESSVIYADLFNTFAFAMCQCFDQSGRTRILDELLSTFAALSSTNKLPEFIYVGNIAEAMLCRAKVADVKTARLLVNQAIDICQARQRAPDYERIANGERINVDLQLIEASRMQIRAGDQPCVELAHVLQIAEERFASIPPQQTSMRMAIVLAQVEVLTLQARLNKEVVHLTNAQSLIARELASPYMSTSVYVVDLLAARAELSMAQSHLEKDVTGSLLQTAWDQFEFAVHSTAGRPSERFQTCLKWANHAEKRGNVAIALKAYSQAIDLLHEVVFLGEEVIGRIEALRQVNGLAASSVAVALSIDDIPTAINFLERTRGILWLQSFRARDMELSSLPDELRHRFMTIARDLETADRLHWTTRRHKAEQLEKAISEIRAFPGFKRFQLPPLLPDVEEALGSKGAYAIVVAPSTSYCDVVILGMENARHLRLSRLDAERIRDLSKKLSTECSFARTARDSASISRKMLRSPISPPVDEDTLAPLLAELWYSLVQPILQVLNLQICPDLASRKRVWWCPTGALSALPLHAAGIYNGFSQDYVGKYVTSSYTPTISALHRLLTHSPINTSNHLPSEPNMLLVAQPNAAGLATLANAQVEIDLINAAMHPQHVTESKVGQGMTVTDVLARLEGAQVLHLACHGHQDQDNPLNSGFELEDGRLTLGQLMQLNTPQAQLAYLSACDSAGMDESRPDEGLNLVGTMIFVGFRSVIGTMWAMDDLDGPFMAERIYARILKNGHLDLDEVPYAVDEAVRQLRDLGVPASRWATYVHFGA